VARWGPTKGIMLKTDEHSGAYNQVCPIRARKDRFTVARPREEAIFPWSEKPGPASGSFLDVERTHLLP